MPILTSRFRISLGQGLLWGLATQAGCAGKVELVAVSEAGGTSATGGIVGASGGSFPGKVSCVYNGTAYGTGVSFPSTDGCNTCSCSSNGTVACTEMGCISGMGGAMATGGARSAGGTPGTGGVASIVPACPGLSASPASLDAGSVCAGVGLEVDPSPVDLFIMLDRTQSMTYTLQGTALTRWDAVTQGLKQFPSYQWVRIGLNYFGKTGNPADPAECDPYSYAEATVPIDYNNGSALVASAESWILGGQTPWYPALQGGLQFSQKWQLANPWHRVAFVFVTDGYPTECDTDVSHIASLVSDALQARGTFAGGPSIYTYFIGIGVDRFNLDTVAKAGGTTQATIVDGPTAPAQFAAALQSIAGSANSASVPCTIALPMPPAGQLLDPNIVSIGYTPFQGGPQAIPRVNSAAYCGGPNGGWYFDNTTAPTAITLCPCSCANLASGSLTMSFGCAPHGIIN